MRRRFASTFTLALLALPATALATGGDTWPALAHDGYRSARSTGMGAITSAPEIAWKRVLGGALSEAQVAAADVDGDSVKELIMVSAGRIVARRADDSTVWKSANIGAQRVVGVVNLDGQGPSEIIAVGSSPQGLYILNAATGATLWFQPTTTTAIDALTAPNPGGGERLFVAQQLGTLTAYQFSSGIANPATNQVWQSGTSPWSIDMAAGDVDGDGVLDLVRGHDRGFVVYDAATGAVKCNAQSLIGGTNAPSYFPAFTTVDVDGDARAEIVVYDYSYYYSEDAGVFVVSCNGNGAPLTPQVRWSQQWITDTTAGPGNNVNDRQIRYLADGVANLDGAGALEMVYSLWDASAAAWTTYVRDASTGAVLATQPGMVIEGVGDVDGDGKADVLLRDANGIGALPKPFFSTMRAYSWSNGALVDKGWMLPSARAATVPGRQSARVTAGAGSVLARQNVGGAADPAAEAYIFQKPQNANVTDSRPGKLLAVHGSDGVVQYKYQFADGVTGSVLSLAAGVHGAGAAAESLVMLTDGGLRVLDDHLVEANKLLPGNHARLVSVASLDGAKNGIYAVDSTDALIGLDGTLLGPNGLPVSLFHIADAAQPESRGYVNAPGLVLPQQGGGAQLVVRGHSTTSYEEAALIAVKADGAIAWKKDVGAGRQVAGFDNFELVDDLDGDGVRDFFLTELDAQGEQQLVIRRGSDGSTMVARPVGDLFPPSGVYLQGHAAADVNGDGKLDIVSALHGSWFVGIDVSLAGTGDPAMGFVQIFRTANGPNGQAMAGQLDGDAELDLVRAASQNAFGAIERRSLAGVVEASYLPPTPNVAGSDANTTALLARPGVAGAFDVVWAGMAGSALGAVARIDGATMSEVWFAYLAGGAAYPKTSPPATRSALFSPIAVDIDGDGADEVVVGADDGFLYALRGSDGSLLFSFDLGAPVVHTIAADIDKDDRVELLCALADGTLVALDAPGGYDADVVQIPDAGVDGGGTGGAGGATSSSSSGGTTTSSSGAASTSSSGGTTTSGGNGGNGGAGGSGGGGQTSAPGGCGCRVAGDDEGLTAGAIAWAALAVGLARRRRRYHRKP